MIPVPGMALALIGAGLMLIAPLQRVTMTRSKQRPYVARPLHKSYPAPVDGGNEDLIEKLKSR